MPVSDIYETAEKLHESMYKKKLPHLVYILGSTATQHIVLCGELNTNASPQFRLGVSGRGENLSFRRRVLPVLSELLKWSEDCLEVSINNHTLVVPTVLGRQAGRSWLATFDGELIIPAAVPFIVTQLAPSNIDEMRRGLEHPENLFIVHYDKPVPNNA